MKKRINIPTILISLVLFALSAVFCAAVLRSGLLPGGWTALLFIALALADGLLIFLCARPGKRLRFAFGLILSLLFAAGLCYGSAVLNKTVNTLQRITEAAPQFSRVCVFVGSEDTVFDGPLYFGLSYTQKIEEMNNTIEAYLQPYRDLLKAQ